MIGRRVVRRSRALAWVALWALSSAAAWAADPQITSVADQPDPVTAGSLYTYTVGVANNDITAATNSVLTLTVPAGASFVSSTAPAGTTCQASGAGLVRCTLGTLGPNGLDVRSLRFTFRALGPGPATIAATATISADNDTNTNNNTQTATTTVNSGADLSLSKLDAPDPVTAGANVTYTLRASNAGPNAAGNVVLTDNLSGSTSFVSASGSGWSCSHANRVVTCTRPGPLAVGASAPDITLVAKVTATGGTVTNSASIAPAAGAVADPDTSNNTATASTTVSAGADVRIAQKVVTSAVPATAGANVSFRIEPRNDGPSAATNVVVSDTLPAGWTFVSASGPNWSCSASGQTVSCTRASMPLGATQDITVVATAPVNAEVGETGRRYTNTASITAAQSDPTPGNNSGSVNIDVRPDGADLRVSKTKSPNPVAQGSEMVSEIRVTNNGPRAATGPIRVIERLNGETFVGVSGTGWSCTQNGDFVICDAANTTSTEPGLFRRLTITTRATASGTVTNEACVSGTLPAGAAALGITGRVPLEGDPNSSNNCVSAGVSSTVVRPDLAISKQTSTPTGGDKIVSSRESAVTYTLVVTNASSTNEDATGVRITDNVPAFISGRSRVTTPVVATVSAGSTAKFDCVVTAEKIVCTQTAGVLARGQTVTIPITVNRPLTEGSFTNTATVTNTREGDPNSANNSASDTVTIEPIADVQMTAKSVTPTPVKAGEIATFVLSYRNNGPSIAQDVTVTDTFTFPAGDPGFVVTEVTASKGSCALSAGEVLNASKSSFNCSIGALANGEAQSITLRGRPIWQPGNAARVYGNTARVSTSTAESPDGTDGGNNSQTVSLPVSPAGLDLLVNKDEEADPINFEAGATYLGYRVTVTNNGSSFGSGVGVTETMTPPAGKRIRFVCDTTTAGGASCNSPSLCSVTDVTSAPGTALPAFSCRVPAGDLTTGRAVGELAVNQSKTLFLRFQVLDDPSNTGDVYVNRARVFSNEPDAFPANDEDAESTSVRRRVDLAISKTPSQATVALRQPFNWLITVTNGGPANAQQVDVTDTLLPGTEVVGPINWVRTQPAGSGTCSLAGLAMTCATGALSPSGSVSITVPVRLVTFPTNGKQPNTAVVDTSPDKIGGVDTTPNDNSSTAEVSVTRSSLSGTVFQDRNRSGDNAGTPQDESTEPRIAGVLIRLTGTDAYGNAVERTATTNSDGGFNFSNLSPADATGYSLTQTQPTDYVNGPVAPPATGASAPSRGGTYARGGLTGNSAYSAIVLGANETATRYNFPEVRRPTLSGQVYGDVNANGTRDSTDDNISGATVRLLDRQTNAVLATTTTDANGAYAFAALDPLTSYVLEQPLPSQPAGLLNGPINPGRIGGAACASGCTAQANNPAAGTDRIDLIDLSAGDDGTAFNFGELVSTTISGTVYVDRNRNGVMNPVTPTGDGRIGGVRIRLYVGTACSGVAVAEQDTDAGGSYVFSNLTAGTTYTVCQTQPAGYADGVTNPGDGDTSVIANAITLRNLAVTGSRRNRFGEYAGSLAGAVYQDTGAGVAANFDNGVRDRGEAGIRAVPVTLTGTDASGTAVNLSTVTDDNGEFRFADLVAPNAAGYTVTQGAIPAASGVFTDGKHTAGSAGGSIAVKNIISSVALGAGAQASGYLFGKLAEAGISGTVYVDRNRNDVIDDTPTDGRLSGVTLTLYSGTACTGTALASTQTNATGGYSFTSAASGGTYTVCQTQPAGYGDGSVNPGNAASSPRANAITVTNLPATGSADNHFGERVATLSGFVYQDTGAGVAANYDNGRRDTGEAPIDDVPLTLTGTDAAGNTVQRSAVSADDGSFSFNDLLAPNAAGYTLTQSAIPAASGAFLDGKNTAGSAGGTTPSRTLIGGIALAAGSRATDYLFGKLPNADISGTVYVDRNRNGRMDDRPIDARVRNVTLTLHAGTSCAGATLATTTTNVEGDYLFDGLAAGASYTICQTQPAGYADGAVNPGIGAASSGSNLITINELPAGNSPDNRFGEQVGSIAGSVYEDTGAGVAANFDNGRRDTGEAGIGNVPVTLTGTNALGTSVILSTTTDDNGHFSFDDLLSAGAGGYTLTEGTIPTTSGSFTDGKDTAGSAGGSTAVKNALGSIALAAGVRATDYLFGELPDADISGTVYIDRNRNGLMDGVPTDGRIAGVLLSLYSGSSCSGVPVATTRTDADGYFAFANATTGAAYALCETQPAGYGEGVTSAGTAASSSAANVITIASLPAAGSFDNRFGERVATLSGSVYEDSGAGIEANFNNGLRDTGEGGLAGVTITLSGVDQGGANVSLAVRTDANGEFRFEDLLAPSAAGYTVTEGVIPASLGQFFDGKDTPGSAGGGRATKNAIDSIPLGAGTAATGYLFGELYDPEISGTVYLDRNRNGLLDAVPTDSRLAGVTLRLHSGSGCSGDLLGTATSDADGVYRFTQPAAGGTYTVCQVQPVNFGDGSVNPGTSARSPAANTIVVSSLPRDGSTANDFGERGASLAGSVYVDFSSTTPANTDNGRRDAGEDGLPGVPVTLSGTDAQGAAVSRSTTSGVEGHFRFDDLPAAGGRGYTVSIGAVPASLGKFLDGRDTAGSVGGDVSVENVISSVVLGGGVIATDYLFGKLPDADIRGTVYVDRNRNGVLDASPVDTRLAGVNVSLYNGVDGCSGAVLESAITDGNGDFVFIKGAAGKPYTVCQTQPVGYADGTVNPGTAAASNAANVITIAQLPASGSDDNRFGERLGTLAGSVYRDTGAGNIANFDNGRRDTGEEGIEGVPMTLTGTDRRGNAMSLSTVTDANGEYSFGDLIEADATGYRVTQGAIPAAAGRFIDGIDTAGTAGGSTATKNSVTAIGLGAGVQARDYLFGKLPDSDISGTVYLDRNRNGVQDAVPIDGRLAGVTLRLHAGNSCAGSVVATTTTDAEGDFAFGNASVGGTYTVCQQQPAAYADGAINPGLAAASVSSNTITVTDLPVTGSSDNRFGEYAGSITGRVFLDDNNDGVRQPAERGIAAVEITLSGTDVDGASVQRSVQTDSDGVFTFADLRAANATGYVLGEPVQPVVDAVTTLDARTTAGSAGGTVTAVTRTPSQISAIVLGAGVRAVDYTFAEVLPVSIAGRVFLDLDDDGRFDLPEDSALSGVRMVVTGTDDVGGSVDLDTDTASDGSYVITGLRPGTYAVLQPQQPEGTANGKTVAGSAGGNATGQDETPSAIRDIALLRSGANSTGNDFAEISSAASVSGRVWLDNDNDGRIGGTESGIAGVTIELSGVDSAGRIVERSTETDGTGAYSFSMLPPGTYGLRQPRQPADTVNGITVAGSTGGVATLPAVTPSAITSIVLAPGAESTANNFGEIRTSADLRVDKTHAENIFTVSKTANYTLTVRNAGELATSGEYTVRDRLPTGLTLTATPTGTGWQCIGAAGETSFTCSSTVVLAAGATAATIKAVAAVGAAAVNASPVSNAVMVEGGGEIEARRPSVIERESFERDPARLPACTGVAEFNACRDTEDVQLAAALSGSVWFDIGTVPRQFDAGDLPREGWRVETVERTATGETVVARTTTGRDGRYALNELIPNVEYALRFREPASNVVFAYPVNGEAGTGSSGVACAAESVKTGASSCVDAGAAPQLLVRLAPGETLRQQSLPIDPSGVVYDSGLRTPVPGARVTLAPQGACSAWTPAAHIVGGSFGGYAIAGNAISMTVGSDGFYQFLFSPSAPASCTFSLTVTPPSGFVFQSQLIEPTAGPLTPAGGAGSYFSVQPQAGPPTGPVGTATTYYVSLTGGSRGANILRNHIPLDPELPSGIALAKTGDKSTAEIGDSVRYTLTFTVTAGALPRQVTVVDRLPAGFTYIPGTATVDDVPIADPQGGVGPRLAFNLGKTPGNRQQVLRYRARAGVGATEGDGINRATAVVCGVPSGCVDGSFTPLRGSGTTEEARYRVRVSGGVFGTEACVLGKVFVDCNNNHVQDPEEIGIPGVRLVLSEGTQLIADSEGKFSLCGLEPRSQVIRVDPSTLPRGARMTTSSNRNLGDAGSLWLDLKNGELHRADFIEGSCSVPVIEQVKARRAQGEIRAPESERRDGPALRFESEGPVIGPLRPRTQPAGGDHGRP